MAEITGEIDGLPVFASDPDAVLYDVSETCSQSSQRIAIAASKKPRFIRQTRVQALGAESLKDVVETADEIFRRTAKLIGAEVVPHIWGLYQTDIVLSARESYSKHLLPDGHVLVAEVDAIREVERVSYITSPEVKELFQPISVNGYYWGDLATWQFISGVSLDEQTRGLWLADIEPSLKVVT